MSLSLNESQFSQFIQFLKDEPGELPIKIAARQVGLQESKPLVWVMGETIQINADGEIIPDKKIKIFWHAELLMESLGTIRINEVLPRIKLPPGTSALKRCVNF